MNWHEILDNVLNGQASDEELMEFYSKASDDLELLTDEEKERFSTLLDKVIGTQKALFVWDTLQKELSQRKDEDYTVNQAQYTRFVALSAFFFKLAKDNGGEIEPIPLEPKKGVGYISAIVKGLKLEDNTREAFFSAIRMFSSFGVTPMADGTLAIEGVVPEVFTHK